MQKKSLQTLTLLATLIVGTGTHTVQAAEKSTVSPDVVAPKAVSITPISPPLVEISAPVQQQPVVDLQTRTSSNDAVNVPTAKESPVVNLQVRTSSNEALRVPIARETPIVNLQARNSSNRSSQPEESIDVVLESRSSGCRASVNRWSDACAISPSRSNVASIGTQSSYYSSYSGSGFTAEIRQLSDRELKAMTLPGNGDKWMQFPLAIPAIISSSFGYRVHPISNAVRFHQGTDIAAAEGTPVLAAYSGTIEVAGWLGGLGLAVVISHGDRHETRYGHLSQVLVKPGQKVKQGTPIGLVGSTGFSTGPHLHFELWQKIGGEWLATDPTNQLVLALDKLNRYLAQATKKSTGT